MITAKQLHAPYRYVVSEELVSLAVNLLELAGPVSEGNSIYLSGEVKSKKPLMGLQGLGKELWTGKDAQQYVNELRDEWSND